MQDAPALDQQALEARREALLTEMVRAATHDAGADLGRPRETVPDRDGASRFLDTTLAWLEAGGGPSAPLPPLDEPGALAYLCVLCASLPEAAGAPERRARTAEALRRLSGTMHAEAGRRLARCMELEDLLVNYLNAMHAVSSPMNVVTLGVDMARMRMESGDMEGLAQALRTIEEGCTRVIGLRRAVADETPEWAHDLRRSRASAGGSHQT